MKDRLFEFIDSLQLTPTEFADIIGISRSAISSIKTGRTQPTLMLLEKIKQKYPNINTDWLILGYGNMYVNPTDSTQRTTIVHTPTPPTEQPKPPFNQLFHRLKPTTEIPEDKPQPRIEYSNYRESESEVENKEFEQPIQRELFAENAAENNTTHPHSAPIKQLETVQTNEDGKAKEYDKRKIIRIITLYSDGTYQQFSPE